MNPQNEIILYKPNDTVHLEVRLENETVWLTQAQMVMLFGRDQSVISKHIGNIFKEGELDKNSVYAKFAYTATDGKKLFAFSKMEMTATELLRTINCREI